MGSSSARTRCHCLAWASSLCSAGKVPKSHAQPEATLFSLGDTLKSRWQLTRHTPGPHGAQGVHPDGRASSTSPYHLLLPTSPCDCVVPWNFQGETCTWKFPSQPPGETMVPSAACRGHYPGGASTSVMGSGESGCERGTLDISF